MAEAIAFNVTANILIKLGDAAFREICLVYGVDDDLKKFQETLIQVNGALLDADRRQEESQLMKDWIRKLNDVVHDADDVLDAFNTKNLQQRQLNIDGRAKVQVCEFLPSSKKLVFRYKMGRKMKKIRERLDEIGRTMSMYKFAVTERVIDQARVGGGSYRDTTSYVAESYVIGREKEKDEIIDMLKLSSNEEKVSIVSIVGIGGLGKTTLAQSVYCDKRVDEHFQFKIWVCVSEDFEKKSLVRKILKSITNNEVGDLEMEQLQSKLRENIDGKKYLLILDDIWNEDHEKWIDVKPFLEVGAQGSKILVTTRSTKVTSAMDVENPYILEGLTEEQSWSLFKKVAFRRHKEVHAYMESIGKETIIRCKGVPLAIRSLGSVLESKTTESQWSDIRNSDIWSSLENNNSILPILKLSYDHLPIHLRQCFVYCSIFPKDHTLKKDLLVQLWMAQGYIQSLSESQNLEDIGDQYFEDLISRSFLQDVKVTSDNVCCKMHDLIHDLAVRVGGPRYCSIAENSPVNISERVNHVSFGLLENVPKQLIQAKAKGLRTYFSTGVFYPSSPQQARPNKRLLSKIRRLRVLDLRGCGFEKLPNLVGKMQHLRLLDLSCNEEMEVLPNSIANLVNLQTLNLFYCSSLKELPESISKLISLRHLIIHNCSKISCMPKGLGKLTALRTLEKFIVDDDNRSAELGELNGLNNLRGKLRIENLEKVRGSGSSKSKEANLMGKQHLKSLTLNWSMHVYEILLAGLQPHPNLKDAETVLEGLQPHPNLKELEIEGYYGVRFPSWIISLPNIVQIILFRCPNVRHLPPFHQLPCLKTLTLKSLREVDYDDDGSSSSSSSFSPSFPCLTHLDIHDCPKLTSMPPLAPLLEKLEIYNCPKLTSMPLAPLLEKLEIFSCPKLTSMPCPPLLETLNLERVSQKLVFQLLTTTATATIPSSSPLSRLTHLTIRKIEGSESLPFFPEGVPQNLTSLKKLTLSDCPNIRQLPPFYQLPCRYLYDLPEVEYDDDGSSSPFPPSFPCLTYLTIYNCPKLTSMPCPPLLHYLPEVEYNDDGSSSSSFSPSFPCLTHLDIYHCPKLTSMPLAPLLETLKIYNCPKLTSMPFAPLLETLEISDCPNLTSMPCPPLLETLKLERVSQKLLFQLLTTATRTTTAATIPSSSPLSRLTHLYILDMEDSESLPFFPEGVPQNLTSLKNLTLRNCPNIRQLPPFYQLPCLKTLTLDVLLEVEYDDGSSSSSFSPSFPCLTHLTIISCPKLTSMPLAPLLETLMLTCVSQKLLCQLLTIPSSSPLSRLTHLYIFHVEGIESLPFFPEGVPQNLTSLKKLTITGCHRLLHLAVSGEIQYLTALEDLIITGGEQLDLTHDGMNWQGLRSLRKIHIDSIPKLVRLPEGLQHITTLQSVGIRNCPGLVDLPEWTSNIPSLNIW